MARNSYPWKTLVNVGDSFTLTEADGAGLKFARQLIFARNATEVRNGRESRFKCEKVAEGMKVVKVA